MPPRQPGFLPPLTFDEDETDAVILGLQLVARRGEDGPFEAAALRLLARIEAALPAAANLGPSRSRSVGLGDEKAQLAAVAEAIRAEEKLVLDYVDKKGAATRRTVWPVAAIDFEGYAMLVAWCETRRDFRHFRLDRIRALKRSGARMPRRHRLLLAEWQAQDESDDLQ